MNETSRSYGRPLFNAVLGAIAVASLIAPAGAGEGMKHDGADAATPHAQHTPDAQPAVPPETAVKVRIPDVVLLDRQGRKLRFGPDALGDRIVAIDFIYTHCTTACPVLSSIFTLVQEELGDRMEREVRLVTVSLDPARDTPARMRKYATPFEAGPNWLWLTGAKRDVDNVLMGLGAYTPDFESHPPMVLIGDPANNRWSRHYGFVSPDVIIAQIDALAAARKSGKSTGY